MLIEADTKSAASSSHSAVKRAHIRFLPALAGWIGKLWSVYIDTNVAERVAPSRYVHCGKLFLPQLTLDLYRLWT